MTIDLPCLVPKKKGNLMIPVFGGNFVLGISDSPSSTSFTLSGVELEYHDEFGRICLENKNSLGELIIGLLRRGGDSPNLP